MKIKLLLIGIFCIISNSYSQKNIEPTPEDITLAKSLREKHSKSDVAVLNSTEKISFGLNSKEGKVTVEHKVNEKLMNINHRADIQKFEFYDSQSTIESFIFKYRNDKKAVFQIKDEFYKSNDLFYNDARVKYATIDFPVQGYTYNFELEKKYKDVKYFTSIYFNDEYPILKKEVIITVPNWLELEIKEFNFSGKKINLEKTADNDTKSTIFKYTIENEDPQANERNAQGPSYLNPHILLIAKSYNKDDKKNTLFSSTADLYKWYKSLVDSMDEKPELLNEKVTELTKNAKTDEEKIKNIYYWVQDNIRYIAFENGIAGFKPDESQNVFTKRYGDCKGMANLMRQMLKLAGFDARLTWIGTKHIAYDYSIPSLSVDNHMICTLFFKGKRYFLDGTEKFNSFGEYAERIQGKEVLIEDGDKYIIDKVPTSKANTNTEAYATNFKIENETLTGKSSTIFTGESRTSFLYSYNNIKNNNKDEALLDYLKDDDKNIKINNINASGLENRDQKINIDYELKVANKISAFDNEIYIDLDYKKEFSKLSMKDRKTDFVFPHKETFTSVTNLEIPVGYKVSKLPESLNITTEDYTIALTYKQEGTKIVYNKHFEFKNGIIKATNFKEWNSVLDQINKIYNEQITLTKS